MPYQVPWGTPERTRRLPKLRPLRPPLILPAVTGATLLALFGLHAAWRGLAAPGPVSQAHGASERRCQECHTQPGGVVNNRCQRCHDAGPIARLSHRAHEQAGRGVSATAGDAGPRARPEVSAPSCASCHREHLGRPALLAPRDDGQCAGCHFRGLASHPEFARITPAHTQAVTPRSAAVSPLPPSGVSSGFSHRQHVAELGKRGVATWDSCLGCHAPSVEARDLQEISFDRHCATCHASSGSLGATDPIPPADVETPRDIGEFQSLGGRIVKTVVRHRDPWVLASLRRLRWRIDPLGAAADRAALEARRSALRRHLALAAPLAGLDLPALEARDAALRAEIAELESRRSSAGGSVEAGLAQVTLASEAARDAGDAAAAREATELRAATLALSQGPIEPATLAPAEHDARRLELLVVIDALASASPEQRLRAEDLRRRVLALRPGDSTEAVVARALDQRRAEQRRVEDEIRLRRSGVVPPSTNLLARERRAIEEALASTAARLQQIGSPPGDSIVVAVDGDAAVSLAALAVRCAPCHGTEGAMVRGPHVTQRALTRATFVHGPHLGQAACESCHAGVERSEASGERNLPGIARCRECHAPRRVLSSCQQCHRYHPGDLP